MELTILLNKVIDKQDLTREEAIFLLEEMLKGNLTPSQIGAILIALRIKGESADEILGFITVMRKNMLKVKTSGLVIDVCGTGGDGKGTFNISTAVAFVVAGAGVKVAKHGNRNASSLCGSADVLEEMGVKINLSPEEAEEMLKTVGFTFLFAPFYHPAMKHVGPVRKELKVRTVFNFLGPFASPAGVKRQIIGVPNIQLAEKLAKVASSLDYERLLIVSSEDNMDEISLSAPTHIFEIAGWQIKEMIINPEEFGLKRFPTSDIQGGDARTNAEIIKNILGGADGAKRDIVLLNSAAALLVSGKVDDLRKGLSLAEKSISTGAARVVAEKVIKYSVDL